MGLDWDVAWDRDVGQAPLVARAFSAVPVAGLGDPAGPFQADLAASFAVSPLEAAPSSDPFAGHRDFAVDAGGVGGAAAAGDAAASAVDAGAGCLVAVDFDFAAVSELAGFYIATQTEIGQTVRLESNATSRLRINKFIKNKRDYYLIQVLLGWERHNWLLSVQLLLGQSFHANLHALLRAQGYNAKAFRLAVCAILKELDLDEIIDSNVLHSIRDVLITRPLQKLKKKKQKS